MSTEVWGLMPKSLIDSEKPEEMAVRLVTAHNDDPSAHLDEGQSLTSHRASEIIDHIAGSIVEDKIATGEISSRCITTNEIIGKHFATDSSVGVSHDGVKMDSNGIEMWQSGVKKVSIPRTGDPVFSGIVKVRELQFLRHFWQTFFASLDGFSVSGTGSNTIGLGGVRLLSGATNGNTYSLYSQDNLGGLWLSDDGDLSFETIVRAYSGNSQEIVFGFSMLAGVPDDSGDYQNGISFEIKSGNVYAVKYRDSGTRDSTLVLSSIPSGFHVYRVNYVVGVGIYYYIDGVLVHTYTTNLPTLTLYVPFGYSVKTLQSSAHSLDILQLSLEGPLPGA